MNPFKRFKKLENGDKIPPILNVTSRRIGASYYTLKEYKEKYPTRALKSRHAIISSFRETLFYAIGVTLFSISLSEVQSNVTTTSLLYILGLLFFSVILLGQFYTTLPHYIYVLRQTRSRMVYYIAGILWTIVLSLTLAFLFFY